MFWIAAVVIAGALIGIGTIANVRAKLDRPLLFVPTGRELLGIGHFIWGALTALVFVPAGFVLAMLTLETHLIFALLLTAVCVSGLVLAKRTLALPMALETDDDETIANVAVFGVTHHAAVAMVFTLGFLIEPFDFRGVMIPCGIGIALAALAARTLAPKERVPRAVAFRKKL